LPTAAARTKLARAVGYLNSALKDQNFICVGPGRWGSSNPDLGVSVDYGDIYNARALVELAGEGIVPDLEPSLGTHFFQDLMEAQVYPLGILMDQDDTMFNQDFFYNTRNHLTDWIKIDPELECSLHLIRVSDYLSEHHMRIVMNSDSVHAVGYLVRD